ncbi:Tubulin polyglutamylase ttll4 [Cichlidogyrus casuarinus]|uniref:Tubulin polyglutamylase ttll4 n=1 Tax=Cichlidogyrus casuarinus TaxID=1844966 RepID=A0ABD2Q9B2_9PLAT
MAPNQGMYTVGRPLTREDLMGPVMEKLKKLKLERGEPKTSSSEASESTQESEAGSWLEENDWTKSESNQDLEEDLMESDDQDILHEEIISESEQIEPMEEQVESSIKPAFIDSLFADCPPTLRFVHIGEAVQKLPYELDCKLKWRLGSITPNVVKKAAARSNFKMFNKSSNWIGFFGGAVWNPKSYRRLKPFQKMNHFPGSFNICRKDSLWSNLTAMRSRFGTSEFNFYPQTFCLPRDLSRFKKVWAENACVTNPVKSKVKWILKPPASARGIGIKILNEWNKIPKQRSAVIQRYIQRPLLVNENKFDLRVYVYVSSFCPLRIYIHEKGLVRFATHKYSVASKSLKNRRIHLTNYSVNKKDTGYKQNSGPEDAADNRVHKWSLKALWTVLRTQNVDTDKLWDDIIALVVKTMCSVALRIGSLVNSYCLSPEQVHELYGVDILVITDMFNTAGFRLPEGQDTARRPYTGTCEMSELRIGHALTDEEKGKHREFVLRERDFAKSCPFTGTSLVNLTKDDLRTLRYCVDEWKRAAMGGFRRIFPLALQEDNRNLVRFVQNDYKVSKREEGIKTKVDESSSDQILVSKKSKKPPVEKSVIVQRYIDGPFLLNKKKFDIRVYVYVTSYYPLRVYVHKKGLVRIAISNYSKAKLGDKAEHVTNELSEKKLPKGSNNMPNNSVRKWSTQALWSALKSEGVDSAAIWEEICAICVKTLCSVAIKGEVLVDKYCKSPDRVHQLFGFDFMIDSKHKVWLLEVDKAPSMAGKKRFDKKLKSTILTDLFNTAGIKVPPKDKVKVARWGPKNSNKLTVKEVQKQLQFSDPGVDIPKKFTSTLVNLTQDDRAVLSYCVDEWQRADMGGFERVFPLAAQDDEFQLARFLRDFDQGGRFRYYDLLVRDFLTHFCYTGNSKSKEIGLSKASIIFLKDPKNKVKLTLD